MIDQQQMADAAQAAVEHAAHRGVFLNFMPSSVMLLDMVLQELYDLKNKDGATMEQIGNVAQVYGAYLGETMLRTGLADLGFAWDLFENGEPCLMREGSEDVLRPLTRCFKRIINGPEADVIYFYSWCFDAVYTEMGITEGRAIERFELEPGKIDAFRACELLNDEYLFLPPEEVIWDGRGHHFIRDVKGNADKFYDDNELMKGVVSLTREAKDLFETVEKDEELMVHDGNIHPALYRAIGEGDLTGITIFVLMTYKDVLKIEGSGDSYTVIYEERLARGIPGFYEVMGNFIYDLRAYNGINGRFEVNFKHTSFETTALDPLDVMLEGCGLEEDKVIEVI